MALAGSLNVLLGMDIAKFSTGAKKGQKELSAFTGVFADIAGGLPGGATLQGLLFGGPAGAALGALTDGQKLLSALGSTAITTGSAFASMVTHTIAAVDAQGDLASRLGMSASGLQKLEFAAKLSDTGIEDLHGGLEKFNVKLGEAIQDSSGPAAKAFSALGLSVNQLAGMDKAEAVKAVGDAISHSGTSAEQAALANDVFGKSGMKLLNFFNSGSAAAKQFDADAVRLGVALSDVANANIGEAAKGIDEASLAWQGFQNLVTAEVAPYVAAITHEVFELAKSLGVGNTAAEITKGIFAELKIVAIEFAKVIDENSGEILLSWQAIKFSIQVVVSQIKNLIDVYNALAEIAGNLDGLIGIVPDDTGLGAEAFARKLLDTDAAAARAAESLKQQAASARELRQAVDPATEALHKLYEKNDKLVEQAKDDTAAAALARKWQLGGSKLDDSHDLTIAKAQIGGATFDQTFAMRRTFEELERINRLKKESADWDQKAKSLMTDALSPLETFQSKLADINRAWEQGILTAAKYWKLVNKAKEDFDKTDPIKEFAKKTLESTKTPLEKFREEIAKIQQAWQAGQLDDAHTALAVLNARKDLAESATVAQDTGPLRPAALLRGSAEAFSASFGAAAKPFDKVAFLAQRQLEVQRSIDEKLGGTFPIKK